MFKINAVHTAQSELFQYDGLNRLTSFSRGTLAAGSTSISGTSSVSQGWNLDVLGNWHSSAINNSGGSTTTTTRTNNGLNQITSVNGTGLGYDFDGNLIQDQTGQSYTYDAWNRVTAISTPAGDSVQYSYDALGRRITESDSATGINTDLYYSNRGQVLNEISVDASGTATDGRTTTFHYIWTPFYVDQLVARDQSVAESDFSTESAGPRSSIESDPIIMALAVRLAVLFPETAEGRLEDQELAKRVNGWIPSNLRETEPNAVWAFCQLHRRGRASVGDDLSFRALQLKLSLSKPNGRSNTTPTILPTLLKGRAVIGSRLRSSL